jgi:hypothetical protein
MQQIARSIQALQHTVASLNSAAAGLKPVLADIDEASSASFVDYETFGVEDIVEATKARAVLTSQLANATSATSSYVARVSAFSSTVGAWTTSTNYATMTGDSSAAQIVSGTHQVASAFQSLGGATAALVAAWDHDFKRATSSKRECHKEHSSDCRKGQTCNSAGYCISVMSGAMSADIAAMVKAAAAASPTGSTDLAALVSTATDMDSAYQTLVASIQKSNISWF